jgi:RimJ/RimL family protein N-acetyltransferase
VTNDLHIPTLETERLDLRGPTLDDLDAYKAFYKVSDLTVGQYRGGRNATEIATILESHMRHWQDKGFGMWLLSLKGSGAFLGGAGLSQPNGWPRHELTWWLMPKTRGFGYASEASRAIIAWAYTHLGWTTVETHMRDENIPARRLAERLGGQKIARETFPDGVTRDIFAFPKEAIA